MNDTQPTQANLNAVAFQVVRDLDDLEVRDLMHLTGAAARQSRNVAYAMPIVMAFAALAYWVVVTQTAISLRTLFEVLGVMFPIYGVMTYIADKLMETAERAQHKLEHHIEAERLVRVPEQLEMLWEQTSVYGVTRTPALSLPAAFNHPLARRSLIRLSDEHWEILAQNLDEGAWTEYCLRAYALLPFCKWPPNPSGL